MYLQYRLYKDTQSKAFKKFKFPSDSNAGNIRPTMAAASIIPAENAVTVFSKRADMFLTKYPIAAPAIVAPPTPSAVNITI